MVEYSTAMP